MKKGQTPRQEFKQGRVVLLDPIDPVTVSSASRHSILASFSQFLRIARYVQRCPESTYKSNRFLCTESRSFESTRRCDCTQLIASTKQVHRLLSSFFVVVEWIDAMIMDGGIWLPSHRDSHAQAGGSGGGRCWEGGGVNYLASNFSNLNDCMEAARRSAADATVVTTPIPTSDSFIINFYYTPRAQ